MIKKIISISVLLLALCMLTACNKEEKKETNTNKYDYMVLVNKQNKLPDDWEEKLELVDTKDAWDDGMKVEKKAYEAYLKLKEDVDNALKEYNATIELDSAYRSVRAQQELWDRWSADPEKGVEYAKKYAAVPGYSEHHTGLAIDICLKVNGELVYENEDMIEEREIFNVVHSKLAKYGFILRYLEGREDSTGYTYEPWHFRYIDDVEKATYIMNNNLTFEEYLNK